MKTCEYQATTDRSAIVHVDHQMYGDRPEPTFSVHTTINIDQSWKELLILYGRTNVDRSWRTLISHGVNLC